MAMDEMTEREVRQNKAVRGYIIRALVKGYQNTLLVRQIVSALVEDGLILAPEIDKYLDYLEEAGYIAFIDRKVSAYTAYTKDAVIKLTKRGVDLVEGTIEDAGVEI